MTKQRFDWSTGKMVNRRPSHVKGEMNKTEAKYAEDLYALKLAGEILDFAFEAITLQLTKDCSFCADFFVQLPDGTMEFHEVKPLDSNEKFVAKDDSIVKIKLASELFSCFRFKMVGIGRNGIRKIRKFRDGDES